MNLPSLSARTLADVTLNAPFSLTSTLHNSWDALISRERFVPRLLTSLHSLKPGFRFSSTLSANTPLYLARNFQFFNILQRLLRVTIVNMFIELHTDVSRSSCTIPSSKCWDFLLLLHFQTTIAVTARLPIENFVLCVKQFIWAPEKMTAEFYCTATFMLRNWTFDRYWQQTGRYCELYDIVFHLYNLQRYFLALPTCWHARTKE
jgi:hypothetical protein